MPQVAIIGAGFSGPVLALCLKKHGITAEVYESREKDYRHGGNIALAPNALRVLDHIGVYDRIRTRGYNYDEIRFDNGSGEVLGKLLNGSKELYNFHALRIYRADVRDELIAELGRQEIPIHYNKKCKGVLQETETEVKVEFEDGEIVEADFVVGTDGIHSLVRKHIAPEVTPAYSGLMGVMGSVDTSQLGDKPTSLDVPCFLFGPTGSFAIIPSSFDGHDFGYFATIEQKEDRGRQGWADLESNKDELHDMMVSRFTHEKSKYPELCQELVRQTPKENFSSWPFFSVPHLDTWSSKFHRVVVIGDAAHAIPPTGGQGAAMALEDAETLAYTLVRVYAADSASTSLDELFKAWEGHRMARIAKVIDFTTKNGNLRKASPHFYEQAAKEWLIWAMFKWMGQGGAQVCDCTSHKCDSR